MLVPAMYFDKSDLIWFGEKQAYFPTLRNADPLWLATFLKEVEVVVYDYLVGWVTQDQVPSSELENFFQNVDNDRTEFFRRFKFRYLHSESSFHLPDKDFQEFTKWYGGFPSAGVFKGNIYSEKLINAMLEIDMQQEFAPSISAIGLVHRLLDLSPFLCYKLTFTIFTPEQLSVE